MAVSLTQHALLQKQGLTPSAKDIVCVLVVFRFPGCTVPPPVQGLPMT